MPERTKFKFPDGGETSGVEDDVALAIFAAECIYGRPRTRLAVRYLVAEGGRRAVLETEGEAGETALRVFTGLCSARFGDDGYRVERVVAKERGDE